MTSTLEELEKKVLEEAEKAQVESDAQMKREIAKDFNQEDLDNLPDYLKNEENAYDNRQDTMRILGILTAVLVTLMIYFLAEVLKVPGQLIKSTIEYAAVGAFILLIFSIILLRVMPKNGKLHVIRIGKSNLEKQDMLRLYSRLDIDEKRTREKKERKKQNNEFN